MPFDLTAIGARHAIDITLCAHKPAGRRMVIAPLPGAPAYVCDTPCGRGHCPFTAAAVAPLPQPKRWCLSLGLAATGAALLRAALSLTEPVGTAADLNGPMSWGGARFYRN